MLSHEQIISRRLLDDGLTSKLLAALLQESQGRTQKIKLLRKSLHASVTAAEKLKNPRWISRPQDLFAAMPYLFELVAKLTVNSIALSLEPTLCEKWRMSDGQQLAKEVALLLRHPSLNEKGRRELMFEAVKATEYPFLKVSGVDLPGANLEGAIFKDLNLQGNKMTEQLAALLMKQAMPRTPQSMFAWISQSDPVNDFIKAQGIDVTVATLKTFFINPYQNSPDGRQVHCAHSDCVKLKIE